MLQRMDSSGRLGWLALQLAMALVVAGACIAPARAATVAGDAAANTADAAAPADAVAPPDADAAAAAAQQLDALSKLDQGQARRRVNVSPVDRRVNLLARELDLSATQQAQVKKVLEGQREQVSRVWEDNSIPAARRVSATQVISDRTADQIRSLLSDEQRKKYIQPRKREVAVGTAGGDVESWMNSTKGK